LDAVGDFFMWLQSGAGDIARFARESERRTVLVANGVWADYARRIGLWDEVVEVNPVRLMRDPFYRLRLLWHIRSLGASLLIQPRGGRIFLQEDAIARVSGASLRIGMDATPLNTTPFLQWLGNKSYDRLIAVSQGKDVHETVRNDEFVRELTGAESTPVNLHAFHPSETEDRVAVALSAGTMGRVWPMEKLSILIDFISGFRPSWAVTILGTHADVPLAQRLQSLLKRCVEDRVGKTSLSEFIDSLASSTLVVCNDSSAFHIAMALQKRVICFLGGGHFGWFAPYPPDHAGACNARVLSVPLSCYWCNWNCIHPRRERDAFPCVSSIPVQAAIDSLHSLLQLQI